MKEQKSPCEMRDRSAQDGNSQVMRHRQHDTKRERDMRTLLCACDSNELARVLPNRKGKPETEKILIALTAHQFICAFYHKHMTR